MAAIQWQKIIYLCSRAKQSTRKYSFYSKGLEEKQFGYWQRSSGTFVHFDLLVLYHCSFLWFFLRWASHLADVIPICVPGRLQRWWGSVNGSCDIILRVDATFSSTTTTMKLDTSTASLTDKEKRSLMHPCATIFSPKDKDKPVFEILNFFPFIFVSHFNFQC